MSVKHRTYFGGSVQSLELLTAKGRATVGVIEPGTFQFEAEDEEHIHVVAGTLRARLPGRAEWAEYRTGEVCVVPAGSKFDVAPKEHVAYLCYYVSPRAGR